MCLITSMLRKQGLIVIWGRARGAVPAHWWILMMSVFLTVCYANMGFGAGGGGGEGGVSSLVTRRKLQSQFSIFKSFTMPHGNTLVTIVQLL